MFDVLSITKAMRECESAMSALAEKAKSETDETKATECRTLFDEKSKEFGKLSGMFDEAKAEQRRNDLIKEAEAFAANVAKEAARAASLNVNPAIEKAKSGVEEFSIYDGSSKAKDAMIKHKAFFDFCAGETVSDNMLGSLGAKSDRGSLFVRVPDHLKNILVGKSSTIHQAADLTGGATDTGAGLTIAPNFVPQYLQYGIDVPTIYDFCRSVPVTRGAALFPMLDQSQGDEGGITVTWDDEGSEITAKQMTSTTYSVATKRCTALARLSNEIINRTSIAFEGELIAKIRRAVLKEWSKAIIWGAAATRPEGILVASGTNGVDRQSTGTVEYQDLVNLKYAVRIAQRMNARFLVSDSAMQSLEAKTDNEGRPLYNENASVGIRAGLIGYPVTPHEFLNATTPTLAYLGEAGDVIFGNWMDYGFGVEQDVMVARSVDRYFEFNETGFRVVSWVAGKVIHPSSFSYLTK